MATDKERKGNSEPLEQPAPPPREQRGEPQPREGEITTTTIGLPLHRLRDGVPHHGHIEVQLRTLEQKRAMRRLFDGLNQAGARMKNGRRVQSYPDVVRYVLKRIAASPNRP